MDNQLDLFGFENTPVARGAKGAREHLPEVAQRIHDRVGLECLVRVVNRWGGCHLDFPAYRESFPTSAVVKDLADEVGQRDAFILAEMFQGTRLQVPLCGRAVRKMVEAEIRAALDKDTPAHVLARKHGTTERTIWRIAKRL